MRVVKPELFEKYKHLKIIDVHNHDADYYVENKSLETWSKYNVDRTVLFGAISEPAAMQSDRLSFEAYEKYPNRIIPFFSGFPIYDRQGIDIVRDNLEKGYFGIGETVAASTYSPLTSHLQWKSLHPMDGNLPDIYKLCSEYKVPILLHIDPPFGEVINRLEEALDLFPDVKIIFAHANVFNPPDNIRILLQKHSNLFIDFFAGFTAYDPKNIYPLEDYIPVILEFPNQILLSTDSATAQNLDYEKAINAMYEVIELCNDEQIGELIARENFFNIIEEQVATQTQLRNIKSNMDKILEEYDIELLNKRMANELIIKYKLVD